ncbi:alcohol dehydrogenase catalytic domain-containing protein [Planosporangium thailandense]|uniref:Alcohol dehydrogenase catalytic domain-containing protein n=1 Tax=Planosporangium thailandense TaxID=765197 RepID=A0ABX0Y6B4_9ACTN|nr:alcohol dehydrogenase catalytic domain-containing protein [Planosporangium thailandense]NJC73672.1 alcohol dehydrogenase catalytic domain-containing protein [Planosporangium thailandense]
MTAVVRMDEQGTPAVLRYEQEAISHSIDNQVLIRQAAIGVHSASVRYRRGSIHIVRHPLANGPEPVGMVELVDPGIRGIHLGDRGSDQFAMVRKASVVARITSDHIPE